MNYKILFLNTIYYMNNFKMKINILFCLFLDQPYSLRNSLLTVFLILSSLFFIYILYFYLKRYFSIIYVTNQIIIYVLDIYRYYLNRFIFFLFSSPLFWYRCYVAPGRFDNAPAGRLAPHNLGRSCLVR